MRWPGISREGARCPQRLSSTARPADTRPYRLLRSGTRSRPPSDVLHSWLFPSSDPNGSLPRAVKVQYAICPSLMVAPSEESSFFRMSRASELMTAKGAATANLAADPAKFAAATPIWSAALAFPPSRLCPASRCPRARGSRTFRTLLAQPDVTRGRPKGPERLAPRGERSPWRGHG